MSYLLTQILVCLFIAGLIGAVIGWFLRGGCSRKLRDCEDEWKMKMGSLESEYSSKLHRKGEQQSDEEAQKEMQAATLKRHAEHVEKEKPAYSYEEELKEKLNLAQNATNVEKAATPKDMKSTAPEKLVAASANYADELKETLNPNDVNVNINRVKQQLIAKGISLSDEKIKLYAENGVDFEHSHNLEDNYYIENVEGIDAKYAQALREMGIKTTQDLVQKLHKNHDAVNQIAKTMQIEPSKLSSWISMADLMQLPGVDSKAAEMMQTVGISSTRELGITNAQSLYNEMLSFNQKAHILPEVPALPSLSLWTKIAKLIS